MDQALTFAALEAAQIRDIFNHVPYEIFCHQWELIQEYLRSDGTSEAYLKMLKRADRLDEKARLETERRFASWDKAITLINSVGGEIPFILGSVTHSIEMIAVMPETGI